MGRPFLLKHKPDLRPIILLASVIVGLGVLDALATLMWIGIGNEQANPFMGYILQYDTGPLIAIRTICVAGAAMFLAYFAAKRYILAYGGLALLAGASLLPLAAHLFLYGFTSLM